jgi:IrrE N-terminal-like domain
VTYIPRARLESRASEVWRKHGLAPAFDAEALLDALELRLLWEPLSEEPGVRVLGALRPASRMVILNETHLDELEGNLGLRRFTVAHEIGHWYLHAEDFRAGQVAIDPAGRTWCRSGARDPIEYQAEMYAASLLIPVDQLRDSLPAMRLPGWPPVYDLAKAFAVTPTAMIVRLEELGYGHRDANGVPQVGRATDPQQGVLFG